MDDEDAEEVRMSTILLGVTQGEMMSQRLYDLYGQGTILVAQKSLTIPTQSRLYHTDPPTLLKIQGEVVLPQKAFEDFIKNDTTRRTTNIFKYKECCFRHPPSIGKTILGGSN